MSIEAGGKGGGGDACGYCGRVEVFHVTAVVGVVEARMEDARGHGSIGGGAYAAGKAWGR